MGKKLFKKCGMFIAFTLAFFIIAFFIVKYNIILIPSDMIDYQFNIVTIATVFAGFSFSVLGILLGLTSTKTMKKMEETTVLPTSCVVIIDSIAMFMVVFFISLYFLLGIDQLVQEILKNFNKYAYIVEICYLIVGVIHFLRSVYRMSYMVYYIFKDTQDETTRKIKMINEAKERASQRTVGNDNDEDWDF